MIVGIDLGTTYSAVATAEGGRPRVLPNRIGELTTPSVVSFLGPSEVEVGAVAKERRAADPEGTVALIKRHMGTDYPLEFHGRPHTPESVSALILRALVEDARAALGATAEKPVRAVVTVPAYFGIPEKEATQQAAEGAGIEVLELVAEPVAAALHYGVADASNRTILVYDLGGGTFDCTVLRCQADGTVAALATDGDSQLGGADVDQRLGQELLDRVSAEVPDDADDPGDDDAFVQEVMSLSEIAKCNLSSKERHRVSLRYAGQVLRMDIDREMLAAATQDMIDRTMAIVDRLLAAAGPHTRVDDVLLVGGSSRLPAVAQALSHRFGLTPKLRDPELAVAMGAAIRADRLAGRPAGIALAAVDDHAVAVLPRAVGLLVRDSYDPAGLREFVEHIVPANTPLPAARTRTFATILDDQATVRIQVYEQAGAVASEEMEHNRRVLDGEFVGLPTMPAGSPIDVTLAIGLDGRLMVTAREPKKGTGLSLEAFVEGVVDGVAARELAATTSAMMIRQ